MSLGRYDTYEKAQKAVDYLSDHEFPVQNVLIVGTDLKQLERVTGRLTRARVAVGGLVSGAWLGLFVGMIFALLDTSSAAGFGGVVVTVAFGAVFGLDLGPHRLRDHRRQPRLHLGHPGGGHPVRGPRRAPLRPAGP